MAELMEYIRSSRTPAVAPTDERAAPTTTQTALAPAVATQVAGSETVIERVEPVVVPAETTVVTPTTTEQQVGTSTARSRMSEAAKMVKDFMRFNPTYFTGVSDPEVAGRWLMTHRRLHQLLEVPEIDQAHISGYCLRGQVAVWWTTYTDINGTPATWGEFRQLFLDEYIPTEVQIRLREQFLSLRQGTMSISQYMDRFRYLMMYAMDVANTERLQIYYFIRGLDERIGGVIVMTGAETLQIVYDRALARKTYLRHRGELGDGSGQSSRSDQRPKRPRDQLDRQRHDQGRRDRRFEQQRGDERQVVYVAAPAQFEQPRQCVRDGGGRGRGQRGRGRDRAQVHKVSQSDWQDTRRCFRCHQVRHIQINCPMSASSSRPQIEAARERVHAAISTPTVVQPDRGATR
ncbi:hypothetical protein Sjap_017870 [Stephania japonica]|uniref:Retrotransposon gag domain-containing protein n=1 Tax=Stephania japonica TaxID=461633 RepID=A0AAP0NKY7_9MAGN